MKNRHYEQRRRQMREYHRRRPWRLDGGLYIPHAYPDPKKLSWWDDVGFILNGRRVIVWWQHPRWVYYDAIEKQALSEVPEPATPSTLEKFLSGQEPGQKNWRKLGRSRKKVVSTTMPKWSEEWTAYFDAVNAREEELMRTGIDLEVLPSMRVEQLAWATGMSLVVPVEVLNKEDVRALAALAKRLLKRETAVAAEFPGYVYGQEQWLSEATLREKRRRTDETVS